MSKANATKLVALGKVPSRTFLPVHRIERIEALVQLHFPPIDGWIRSQRRSGILDCGGIDYVRQMGSLRAVVTASIYSDGTRDELQEVVSCGVDCWLERLDPTDGRFYCDMEDDLKVAVGRLTDALSWIVDRISH